MISVKQFAQSWSEAVLLYGFALVVAGCQVRQDRPHEGSPQRPASSIGWQLACENRLDSIPEVPQKEFQMQRKVRWTLNPTPPLGRVVGLAWDNNTSRIIAADNTVSEIAILDSLGGRLGTIGRYGQGPGDIDIRNMAGGTNRIALMPSGAIAVQDVRHLKVFAPDGQLLHWLQVDSATTLARFDMELLATGDGDLIAVRSGKQHNGTDAFEERTTLTLVRVRLGGAAPAVSELGKLANSYVMLKPTEPFPGYQPYRRAYRRSWGGFPLGIVAQSWKRFGVCYFDWAGNVVAAHSLDATRLRVDAAEKERVLLAEMGGPGPVPFLHTSAEDLYQENWPQEGPLYTDIVVREDGTAWALRWTSAAQQMIDVFTPGAYVGSFRAAGGGLPFLLRDSMAFSIDNETGNLVVEFTGERSWLP